MKLVVLGYERLTFCHPDSCEWVPRDKCFY